MRFSGKQPRLLPDVMQAIVDLKEGQGSTQNKILEHVQAIINTKKNSPKPRNVTMQIRRALKHGVQNGLIKQRAGKFSLGIHPKDFALYKSFQQAGNSINSCCSKCRRHKGRRRRRRRRSRRRHMGDYSDTDYSTKDYDSYEPVEARRRRRRRRRRGRRRRDLSFSRESSNMDETNKSPKISKDELIRPQRSSRKI
ncbi:hypothetical protein NQ315_005881 [Exocentrus adspersus]|uniref:H15 domain-containing protein n=1 Tax=Exocentrus adspersus TaxID=1586481 RepID=A0AAV8VS72_9CUCU|nr:hypothetical protein NQ315_005881 [Exocentrus adspersus]